VLRLAFVTTVAWYALYYVSDKAIVLIFGQIDFDLWTRIAAAVRGAS
jgi:hypothetical protein